MSGVSVWMIYIIDVEFVVGRGVFELYSGAIRTYVRVGSLFYMLTSCVRFSEISVIRFTSAKYSMMS